MNKKYPTEVTGKNAMNINQFLLITRQQTIAFQCEKILAICAASIAIWSLQSAYSSLEKEPSFLHEEPSALQHEKVFYDPFVTTESTPAPRPVHE